MKPQLNYITKRIKTTACIRLIIAAIALLSGMSSSGTEKISCNANLETPYDQFLSTPPSEVFMAFPVRAKELINSVLRMPESQYHGSRDKHIFSPYLQQIENQLLDLHDLFKLDSQGTERLKVIDDFQKEFSTLKKSSLKQVRSAWAQLVTQLSLQDYLKQLRNQQPALLRSLIFQSQIQKVLSRGIEGDLFTLALQGKWFKTVPLFYRFTAGAPSSLYVRRLKENGIWPTIHTHEELFDALMLELLINAHEATKRQFIKNGIKAWPVEYNPVVEFKREPEGLHLLIHDQGDPNDFLRLNKIGNSNQGLAEESEREPLGIGRYRALVIAKLLGFKLTHITRAGENPGSTIDVFIPSSEVTYPHF